MATVFRDSGGGFSFVTRLKINLSSSKEENVMETKKVTFVSKPSTTTSAAKTPATVEISEAIKTRANRK